MTNLGRHLVDLLDGGIARATAAKALAGFPTAKAGAKAPGFEHTAWQLLEHLRITQWDALRYAVDPKHASPDFPAGYWPATPAPPDAKAWSKCARSFLADLKAFQRLVSRKDVDPLARITHAPDATVMELACMIANHNAYHLGQLVQLRRALGLWT
jgi:hypothetical protein